MISSVNSLSKTFSRQRHGCDLNPSPWAIPSIPCTTVPTIKSARRGTARRAVSVKLKILRNQVQNVRQIAFNQHTRLRQHWHTRINTRCNCKAKPDCSPPGYPPSSLLIIVNWSVNQFAYVQRSTCTSCRISLHASVGKYPGEISVPRCTVVNRNHRRSTPCITPIRRPSASRLNAQSLLHIGHRDEKIVWIEQTKIGCYGNIPRNPISQQ